MNALQKDTARPALVAVPALKIAAKPARKPYAELDIAELVQLCREKDQRAFAEVVKRNSRTVNGLLRRLAPDWSDTSDLAQEVYVRMWRYIGQLENPARFRSWLYRIVMNLFYDELRKKNRTLATNSLDEAQYDDEAGEGAGRDIADPSVGPEEQCINKELESVVRDAMQQLPHQFRQAIELRELNNLSYEEIAEATGVGVGTVKSRIARARAQVRELITPFINSDK